MFELYSMPTAAAVWAETRFAGLTRYARNRHPTGGAEVSGNGAELSGYFDTSVRQFDNGAEVSWGRSVRTTPDHKKPM